MATPPSSSRSATVEYGHNEAVTATAMVTDEALPPSYSAGVLEWDRGKLRDEDIITATRLKSSKDNTLIGYTILSLPPAEPSESTGSTNTQFKLRATSATNLPEHFLDKYLFQSLPEYLDPDRNQIHVLISTLSGTGLALDFFDKILQSLLGAIGLNGSDYNVLRTTGVHSVIEFSRSVLLVRAKEGRKQTVLMLSGDGGIVDTVNGLLESGERPSTYSKPTLLQIPLGTGNALFHSLHRPSPLPSIYLQGLRTLIHGAPRPLPIFQAKFSPGARLLTNEGQTATPFPHNTLYGAVVASYGLHATLVADSDTTEYRKHGDKRFGLVAKDLLFPEGGANPHAYKADVTLYQGDGNEGVIVRNEHGYILASLVSNLEKTFTISPSSKPLDGQLRVVHFGAISGVETMGIMTEAYNQGNHVGMEAVGYESIDGLKIQFREEGENWKWRRCCVDGLIVGVEEGGWMDVRRVEGGGEAVDVVVDV